MKQSSFVWCLAVLLCAPLGCSDLGSDTPAGGDLPDGGGGTPDPTTAVTPAPSPEESPTPSADATPTPVVSPTPEVSPTPALDGGTDAGVDGGDAPDGGFDGGFDGGSDGGFDGPCRSHDDCPGAPDDSACRVPLCDTTTGECLLGVAPDGADCDDGDVCTRSHSCVAGVCVGADPMPCEEDDDVCTDVVCVSRQGCQPVPNTASCDDDDPCTVEDSCNAGVCEGTPRDCDNGCRSGQCEIKPLSSNSCEALGWPAGAGRPEICAAADLLDGDACPSPMPLADARALCDINGARLCTFTEVIGQEGALVGCGVPLQRVWTATACDDGTVMTLAASGSGLAGAPPACLPADALDQAVPLCCADVDPTLRIPECIETISRCDDEDACTADFCGLDGVCLNAEIRCDDDVFCNGAESCDPEVGCVSGELPSCDDEDPCTQNLCPEDRDACANPPVDCDDDLDCTADSCDADGQCLHDAAAREGQSCEDGLGCTTNGSCASGMCESEAVVCADGAGCRDSLGCVERDTSERSCADLGWATTGGSPAVCGASDGGPLGVCSGEVAYADAVSFCESVGARLCTLAEMEGNETLNTGCGYNATRNWTSTPCADGGHATAAGSTAFAGGVRPDCRDDDATGVTVRCCADVDPGAALADCAQQVTDCDDADVCTADACLADGSCENVPVACGDADACNGVEVCDPVDGCMAGDPPDCDDGDPCTVDSCDPTDACVHLPVDCDDGNPCTVDSCDATGVCEHTEAADGTACQGADPCLENGTCTAGACEGGTLVDCSAGEGDCVARTCVTQAKSVESCAALGWRQAGGDAGICGESDAGLGGCSGVRSFGEADAFCAAAGARLCTVEELQAGAATGTGCGYDANRIWTRSACGPGAYLTRAGANSQLLRLPVECTAVDAGDVFVRCCADAEPTLAEAECEAVISPCPDIDACTVNSCDVASGDCVVTPLECGDNDVCNGIEGCDPVTGCLPGTPLDCGSGGACDAPSCDPVTGCVSRPLDREVCGLARSCNGLLCEADACFALPDTVFFARDFGLHGAADWSTRTEHGESSLWEVGPAQALDSGAGSAPDLDRSRGDDNAVAGTGVGAVLPAAGAGGLDCLISPPIDLGAAGAAWLSFYRHAHVQGGCLEFVQAWSQADRSDLQSLWSHDCGVDGPLDDADWTPLSFDLSAFAGGELHFEICSTLPADGAPEAERGAGWSVDDVSVTAMPAGCLDAGAAVDCLDAALYCAPARSAQSCQDLGWPSAVGDPAVCGESDLPNCQNDADYATALATCEANGARLCTAAELMANETAGTGCGHDARHVWSSSACAGGYEVRAGNLLWRAAYPPECRAPDGQAAVRCCADAASP